jgi:hypothetical protein
MLFVATPSYGGLSIGHVQSIHRLAHALGERNVDMTHQPMGGFDGSLARALLLGRFLRGPASHLLFVDDDIEFEPATVIAMLDVNVDVIGAACPRRKIIWDRFEQHAAAGDPNARAWATEFDIAFDEHQITAGQLETVNGAFRCRFLNGGFMLISRMAAERMVAAYPSLRFRRATGYDGPENVALFDPVFDGADRIDDDYAFCRRWTAIGGDVWCLVDAPLKHRGPFVFEGNFADRLPRAKGT